MLRCSISLAPREPFTTFAKLQLSADSYDLAWFRRDEYYKNQHGITDNDTSEQTSGLRVSTNQQNPRQQKEEKKKPETEHERQYHPCDIILQPSS